MEYPPEQIITTDKGIFYLRITPQLNSTTRKTNALMLNLGSKVDDCVQLYIPLVGNDEKCKLIWVKSKGECSLERYIERGFAQHMVSLILSIAQSIRKDLKRVYFDDISHFDCDMPDGSARKVPMKPFYIAFHSATWYEEYFGAKLDSDYELYSTLKMNRYDPRRKPTTFDFINEELSKELDSMYKESDTWDEFFDKISRKYDTKKCSVIYPWIENALYEIFEGNNIFNNIKWYIDFQENKAKNKSRPINFTSYHVSVEGGARGRKTRKNNSKRDNPVYYIIDRPEIIRFKYLDFLAS